MAALSNALITHKRIETTLAKARALRAFIEPLVSRAKNDTTANRRQVFRHVRNKHAVTELFGDIAERVGDRPGGYTRVIKLGQRAGDSADMAVIELVDYNDVRPEGSGSGSKSTTRRSRRTRRSSGSSSTAKATQTTEQADADVVEAPVAAEPLDEQVASAPVVDVPLDADPGDDEGTDGDGGSGDDPDPRDPPPAA